MGKAKPSNIKTTLTKQPKSRVKLLIEVPGELMQKFWDQALEAFQKEFELPGFRKGHAPTTLVLERIGHTRVEQAMLETAVPHGYLAAVREHSISPIGQPSVAVKEIGHHHEEGAAKPFIFEAEVDVLPPISVSGWEKIRIKRVMPKKVAGEDVDKTLQMLARQAAKIVAVDRGAEKSDQAEIEFTGTLDGVPKEALTSSAIPVQIGGGALVPGFEDNLVGMKRGEVKSFDVIFPESYKHAEFAGKTVNFTVTMREVRQVQLPAVNAEFAKNFGKQSAEELEHAIHAQIERERIAEAHAAQESALIEALKKQHAIELPQKLVEAEAHRLRHDVERRLQERGLSMQNFLQSMNKTEADFAKDMEKQAVDVATSGLLLDALADEQYPKKRAELQKISDDKERQAKYSQLMHETLHKALEITVK